MGSGRHEQLNPQQGNKRGWLVLAHRPAPDHNATYKEIASWLPQL